MVGNRLASSSRRRLAAGWRVSITITCASQTHFIAITIIIDKIKKKPTSLIIPSRPPMSMWSVIVIVVVSAAAHGVGSAHVFGDGVDAGVSRWGIAVAVFVARGAGWVGTRDFFDGVVGSTHGGVVGWVVVVIVVGGAIVAIVAIAGVVGVTLVGHLVLFGCIMELFSRWRL